MAEVSLRIRRYNPERDREPHWEEYTVPAEPTDRVLDLLHQVKWYQDGTLTFRRSCAHGVCGSDAMRINGRNRLACKTLLKDLDISKPITVEPIKGLPVEKDLIVDMEPFFQAYRDVMKKVTSGDSAGKPKFEARKLPEFKISAPLLKPYDFKIDPATQRAINSGISARIGQDIRRSQDIAAYGRNPTAWRGRPPF